MGTRMEPVPRFGSEGGCTLHEVLGQALGPRCRREALGWEDVRSSPLCTPELGEHCGPF